MPPEIVILSTLRALIEVAGLMLLVRGALWLLGPRVRTSLVYGLISAGSMPFIRLARKITPRAVGDRYVPAIAFIMLLVLWLGFALSLHALCTRPGAQCV